jgi:hypothetical protein
MPAAVAVETGKVVQQVEMVELVVVDMVEVSILLMVPHVEQLIQVEVEVQMET